MVELNVGGTHFATTSTTLLACGHSVFHELLTDRSPSAGPIFVDWSPRAFDHVLKGLRTKDFRFVDALAAADRDDVLEALTFLKLDVAQCGSTTPNDDATVGAPMLCPSKRPATTTERFEELSTVGDPETGTRFTTTPPPEAVSRKQKARARLEKEARKRRKMACVDFDDDYE